MVGSGEGVEFEDGAGLDGLDGDVVPEVDGFVRGGIVDGEGD